MITQGFTQECGIYAKLGRIDNIPTWENRAALEVETA